MSFFESEESAMPWRIAGMFKTKTLEWSEEKDNFCKVNLGKYSFSVLRVLDMHIIKIGRNNVDNIFKGEVFRTVRKIPKALLNKRCPFKGLVFNAQAKFYTDQGNDFCGLNYTEDCGMVSGGSVTNWAECGHNNQKTLRAIRETGSVKVFSKEFRKGIPLCQWLTFFPACFKIVSLEDMYMAGNWKYNAEALDNLKDLGSDMRPDIEAIEKAVFHQNKVTRKKCKRRGTGKQGKK